MKRTLSRAFAAGLLSLGATASHAELRKTCLPQNDAGNGLSLLVQPDGQVRVFHLFKLGGGHLAETTVAPDGSTQTQVITQRVLRLGTFEVKHTDAVLGADDKARLCYMHGGRRELEVAIETDDGWVQEVIAEGEGADESCSILMDGERLTVLFRTENALKIAWRRGVDDWVVSEVERGPGVGQHVDAFRLASGELVAAHRGDAGFLRVSWLRAGRWQTVEANELGIAAGWKPSVAQGPGNTPWIVHGVAPGDSDGGLLITRGPLDRLRTQFISEDNEGGAQQAVARRGRLMVGARVFRRSVLFGAYDGLKLYDAALAGARGEVLEESDAAGQRRGYRDVNLSLDPFGEPVLLYFVDAAPFGNDPGSGSTCLQWPVDTDGDRVPDAVELRRGLDPESADTDGDGRSDGEEMLIDFTNPNGDGELPPEPDMGVPPLDPDMGVEPPDPDMGVEPPDPDVGVEPEPDVGAVEPLPDGGIAPDAAIEAPDAAAVAPDASEAVIDAAVEGPRDAQLSVDVSFAFPDAGAPRPDRGIDPNGDAAAGGSAPIGSGCTVSSARSGSGAPSAPVWALVPMLLLGLLRRR